MSDCAEERVGGIDWITKSANLLPKWTATLLSFNRADTRKGINAGRDAGWITHNLKDWFWAGRRSIELNEDVLGLGSYEKNLEQGFTTSRGARTRKTRKRGEIVRRILDSLNSVG